ncbi:MAG: glucokinase [Desulfobacteraceae bacterium]|nr:MAG: glucokinase [Desulfobacteraceae bacterium]
MILSGDIGGTKTRLAVFEADGGILNAVCEETYPSTDFKSLEEIVGSFLSANRKEIQSACFGVAGPVKEGRSRLTNLPWQLEERRLAKHLKLSSVCLINDIAAVGYGVGCLRSEDLFEINRGADRATGNAAIIAAGTGLGEAGLFWDGRHHHPFACEGGHVDFSPRNDLEMDLLRYLLKQFEHVSYERVLSGPGLLNIYRFLQDVKGGKEPDWLEDAIGQEDPPAVIAREALAGRSDLCERALDLFVSLYGAEAGNLALKTLATGGVYIGGGVAPKILEKLTSGIFMEAFLEKGRMKPLLEAIPVRLILNDRIALIGAARCAQREAEGIP